MTVYEICFIILRVISLFVVKTLSPLKAQMSFGPANIDEILRALYDPTSDEFGSNLERLGPMCTDIVMRIGAVSGLLKDKKNVIYLYSPSNDRYVHLDHKAVSKIWRQYVNTGAYIREGMRITERLNRQILSYTQLSGAASPLNVVCSHGDELDMILIDKKLVKDIATKHNFAFEDALKTFLNSLHERPMVAFASRLHDLLSDTKTKLVKTEL